MLLTKSIVIVLMIHLIFFLNINTKHSSTSNIALKLSKITSTPQQGNKPNQNTVGNEVATSSIQQAAGTASEITSKQETYLDIVKKIIEAKKYFPVKAQQLRIEGTVELFFKITSNGKIENIKTEGDVHQILKDSTYKLISSIESLPAPPSEYSNITINIPIEFKLE